MKKNTNKLPLWKNVDEYYAFTQKHKVFGGEAVKLKTQMDKLKISMLPRIRPH